MKYIVKVGDEARNEIREIEVDAGNVFDAIDKAAAMVDTPEDAELIEAFPAT